MTSPRRRRPVPPALLVLALIALLPTGAAARTLPRISALGPATTVAATDGRRHLVYEMFLYNNTRGSVRLDRLTVLDPSRGAVLTRYAGAAVRSIVDFGAAEPTATVPRGKGAFLLLDIGLRRDARVPARLDHRFGLTLHRAGTRPHRLTVARARVRVDRRAAVRLGPPLRAPDLLVQGCCGRPFAHRLAALDDHGRAVFAQRYAIDFVRLGDTDTTYAGDPSVNANYYVYGSEVVAVAAGRVSATRDGVPQNTPQALPPNVALNDLAGNFVNQDLGGGRFALYAHLQPGSLRVKPGDHVERGQVLGLVGNSGNSSEPHLHFHVMNGPGGPSNLLADGLPYVFDAFMLESHVGLDRTPPVLTRLPVAAPHKRAGQYPVTGDIVSFG